MEYLNTILSEADRLAQLRDVTGMYRTLRDIPLADYCLLHLNTPSRFPGLAKALPTMPSIDVQKKWVGDSGVSLMARSCSLLRLFDVISWKSTGKGLKDKKILDYGCGWGRLLRLMNYYSDPVRVCGVDVMQQSLDMCISSGLHNRTALISSRPSSDKDAIIGSDFDFVYLFSVFSHTPEEVTLNVLRYIADLTNPEALVISTIRTIEWLQVREKTWPEQLLSSMTHSYRNDGYAFIALNGDKGILNEADYGDTIMTPSFFSRLAQKAGWQVVDVDRDILEPFQVCVALRKFK